MFDMEATYTDPSGRSPDYTELYTGDFSGQDLTAGVYISICILINTDLSLKGSFTDVFIFQIAGTLTQASATIISLTRGILAKTNNTLNTNASVNKKLYAQTAVTSIANRVAS